MSKTSPFCIGTTHIPLHAKIITSPNLFLPMRILPAYVKRKLMWSLFWIRIDLNSRKWPEPVLRFLTFGNYFTRTSGNELMVRRQERTTLCFTDINVFVILPSPTRGQHIDVRFGKALHTSTWWLLSLHIHRLFRRLSASNLGILFNLVSAHTCTNQCKQEHAHTVLR